MSGIEILDPTTGRYIDAGSKRGRQIAMDLGLAGPEPSERKSDKGTKKKRTAKRIVSAAQRKQLERQAIEERIQALEDEIENTRDLTHDEYVEARSELETLESILEEL